MPRGTCNYPDHHNGPSVGPVVGWLTALGLGALIMTHLHEVILVLVAIGVLAALAVPVFLLWHNHRSGYDPELEQKSAAEEQQRQAISGRQPAAIEAAPVHNHLHLHGVSSDEMTEAVRKAMTR